MAPFSNVIIMFSIIIQLIKAIDYLDHVSSVIGTNFQMFNGDAIYSLDGNTKWAVQMDGNCVLSTRASSSTPWISQFQSGSSGTGAFAVQNDGNLVMYSSDTGWQSNSYQSTPYPPYHFIVNNDGYAYLLDSLQSRKWTTLSSPTIYPTYAILPTSYPSKAPTTPTTPPVCWESDCSSCLDQSSCIDGPSCIWSGINCFEVSTSTSLNACDGDIVYGVFNFRDAQTSVAKINITDGSTQYITTSFDDSEWDGFMGSAVSNTNEIYVVLNPHEYMWEAANSARSLATLSLSDGTVTIMGKLGNDGEDLGFGSITFDCDGQLYGITGDAIDGQSATYKSSIFKIDTNTADIEFLLSLNSANNSAGETIAYNWDNGKLYRLSGVGSFDSVYVQFESIDLNNNNEILNIIISDPFNIYNNYIGQVNAFEYIGNGVFIGGGWSGQETLFAIDINGVALNYISIAGVRAVRGLIPTFNNNQICKPFCPTLNPTSDPTHYPTDSPTQQPTDNPTRYPTSNPINTQLPTLIPSESSELTSLIPSTVVTLNPSETPTSAPHSDHDSVDVDDVKTTIATEYNTEYITNDITANNDGSFWDIMIPITVLLCCCLFGVCVVLIYKFIKSNKDNTAYDNNEPKVIRIRSRYSKDESNINNASNINSSIQDTNSNPIEIEGIDTNVIPDDNVLNNNNAFQTAGFSNSINILNTVPLAIDPSLSPEYHKEIKYKLNNDEIIIGGYARNDPFYSTNKKTKTNLQIDPQMDPIYDKRDNEREEVQKWLKDKCGFPEYYNLFISNGYESLYIIKDIENKKEIKEIGITLIGHQTKIWSEIKKLNDKIQQKFHKKERKFVRRQTDDGSSVELQRHASKHPLNQLIQNDEGTPSHSDNVEIIIAGDDDDDNDDITDTPTTEEGTTSDD